LEECDSIFRLGGKILSCSKPAFHTGSCCYNFDQDSINKFIRAYEAWADTFQGSPEEGFTLTKLVEARQTLEEKTSEK